MLRSGAVLAVTLVVVASAACAAPSTVPPASRPVVSSPVVSSQVASSPVASSPLPKVPGPAPEDVGDLEDFVQASATMWWATVVGNLSNQVYLVRTVDAGQHWQDVTPSITKVQPSADVSTDVLSADVAWLEIDAEPATPQLFRTSNGGQSWQRIGTVPQGCSMQFLDVVDGWCDTLQGAAGSMGVELYRTQDGGVTWQLVSRTTGDGVTPDTVDALPFGCDKQLTFTSANVAWASSFCAGGDPYLDISTDGGARWHAVTPPPFPAWASPPEGEGLSNPAVSGDDIAIVDLGGFGPDGGSVDTSSDGGRSWRMHPLPTPPSDQFWNVDLIDPTHWRATEGDVILSTDDAGAHWNRWTPSVSMLGQGALPLNLDFISPEIGTASDPADRTPLWSTTDGGVTWTKVVIDAGPYVLK